MGMKEEGWWERIRFIPDTILAIRHHNRQDGSMLPLSVGLDEAGRGCVIGPLVIAIVAAEEKDRRWFKKRNVRDSKLVPAKQREDLAWSIKDRCWHQILIISPKAIDEALYDPSRSLNELEIERMIALLRHFQEKQPVREARILIDAMSTNAESIRKRFQAGSRQIDHHRIQAKHKADRLDRTVAAASLLAKAERERQIETIKRECGIDFGSGYCHDPRTTAFLGQCAPDCTHVRWSWATARRVS
ncbi:ribonuclease HII [Candidatus Uhrbacteria bacterium]|nr:ribonuclease HII [Candidatus Uhrbacteria bacterium]MBD3284469.1 ribonuclease HII [Candidatus Uhrbacteria bacterium]